MMQDHSYNVPTRSYSSNGPSMAPVEKQLHGFTGDPLKKLIDNSDKKSQPQGKARPLGLRPSPCTKWTRQLGNYLNNAFSLFLLALISRKASESSDEYGFCLFLLLVYFLHVY